MTDKVNIMTEATERLEAQGRDLADAMHLALAGRIAALRRQRDMSFDQLASQCGISKGMVVAIEQGKANPSIATLCRLAAGLRLSVTDLLDLSQAVPSRLQIIPPDGARELWRGPNGGSAILLVGSDGPDMLEQWIWTLFPGERFDGDSHSAGTQELLHVLDGSLLVEIEGNGEILPQGASAHARTDCPHAYACNGTEPVRFVMTVWEPGRRP
ncbi:XRE family transcriptional regulator [Novosphingobium sp. MMS21-SN21R]|uniref:helix-turn-helix domain-containing protein n=1 Tax=Novosphingobium sp. MMS21-SN21R TaxID=2969298 RepID=UPI0028872023|nr:XRE family transcriptional regulator [Novosphingobium sp. MMS21-SN21R]MDT0510186.1 XRE family transcriptional regulator [Novosphingobium sp. MMS21-SN21R]